MNDAVDFQPVDASFDRRHEAPGRLARRSIRVAPAACGAA
jgi:hypothetical protein